MKFNWGVGITIVIIAFMTFILSFVYKAANTSNDLTSEDYYEQEINYQETIDAKSNAVNLKDDFKFTQSADYFIIAFPESVTGIEEGNVHFYRPEDADKDKHFKLELSNGMMAFPKSNLIAGGYQVKVYWTNAGKHYLIEEKISIE